MGVGRGVGGERRVRLEGGCEAVLKDDASDRDAELWVGRVLVDGRAVGGAFGTGVEI